MTHNDTIKPIRLTYKKQIGHLYAFITQHQTGENFRYTVSFEKQDRNTSDAPNPATFGPEDLLLLAKLADASHTSIMQVESKCNI
ncbi:hypothetical protein [Nostoc sp.]